MFRVVLALLFFTLSVIANHNNDEFKALLSFVASIIILSTIETREKYL